MPDVVRAAGLSTGAVYSYFPSKGDLIRAVCEDTHAELPKSLDATEISRFFEVLRAVGQRGHASLLAQIHAAAAVDAELAELVRSQREEAVRLVTEVTGDRVVAEGLLAVCLGYQAVLGTGDVDEGPYVEAALKVLRGN